MIVRKQVEHLSCHMSSKPIARVLMQYLHACWWLWSSFSAGCHRDMFAITSQCISEVGSSGVAQGLKCVEYHSRSFGFAHSHQASECGTVTDQLVTIPNQHYYRRCWGETGDMANMNSDHAMMPQIVGIAVQCGFHAFKRTIIIDWIHAKLSCAAINSYVRMCVRMCVCLPNFVLRNSRLSMPPLQMLCIVSAVARWKTVLLGKWFSIHNHDHRPLGTLEDMLFSNWHDRGGARCDMWWDFLSRSRPNWEWKYK